MGIVSGISMGSFVGLLSSGVIVYLLGGSEEIIFSMLPKSATTPISVEIVDNLGGIPEIGAVLTVLTGLWGSMIGPFLFRIAGIKEDIAIGAAMGTAAHGI